MASIFLSYAHEDREAAKRIVDALTREGLDVWWDQKIPPGRSWDDVIGQRIGAAGVVIVIWSARSVESNFVKDEAQLAYDAGKLLPVKLTEIEPPMGFRRVHAANLVAWRGEPTHAHWQLLLREVRVRLDVTANPVVPAPSSASSSQTEKSATTLAGSLWVGEKSNDSGAVVQLSLRFHADGTAETVINHKRWLSIGSWLQDGTSFRVEFAYESFRTRFSGTISGNTMTGTYDLIPSDKKGAFQLVRKPTN